MKYLEFIGTHYLQQRRDMITTSRSAKILNREALRIDEAFKGQYFKKSSHFKTG